MTNGDKYKRISLSTAGELGGSGELAVNALNKSFQPDEFHVVVDPTGVEVWLREIDLKELSAAISIIESEFGNGDLLRQIYNAVDGIRSYGRNGNNRLYVGYNKERKVSDRKTKEIRRGKHYYANDHTFETSVQQLPEQFSDVVICGDSEMALKELPANCVDLVFTSPPYNFGLEYSGEAADGEADAVDWESYFGKLFAVFDECIRVLKYGGRIVVNLQPLYSDYIPSHHIVSKYFMDRRLIWKGEILWEKNNYNCKYTAWGSWKSPSSPYLKYTWEFVEVFCKGSLRKKGRPEDADIDDESFKKWVTGKWSIAPEHKMRKFGHPAMFPEELARRVLLLFSFRGDVILDPFNGAGTTTKVACQNGRHYLGIDTSPEYCKTARNRINGIQTDIFR